MLQFIDLFREINKCCIFTKFYLDRISRFHQQIHEKNNCFF